MKKFYEISIISIIFIVICFIYRGQQRITLNGGKGWDGVNYYNMAEQIQKGSNTFVADLPHIKRLGTPFLIAHFSNITGINILDSALYINLAGAYITVLLLLIWLGIFIKEFWITGLLCFLFMMAWYAPVRYSFYVPLTTDSWGSVWFMAGLLLLYAIRKAYGKNNSRAFITYVFSYAFIISIGTLFRETNTVLCILPFFILNPVKILNGFPKTMTLSRGLHFFRQSGKQFYVWQTFFLFVPVIFIALTTLLVKKFIVEIDLNEYSYLKNTIFWLFTKSPLEYFLGILIAFGPLILLLPFYYKQFRMVLWENQELFLLLIISIIFGFIGGTDTERILFMSGFPVIFLILGISLRSLFNSSQKWWLYVLLILQSIAFRFFWMLPDYNVLSGHTPVPFFGFMSNHVKYLYLYSHFSNYKITAILLSEYFVLFLATGYVIGNKIVLKRRHEVSRT
jgi:hypothetical protein